MKKVQLIILSLAVSTVLFSQNTLLLHQGGQAIPYIVSETDSMFFTGSGTVINFRVAGSLFQHNVAEIDSITFTLYPADTCVYINYNGSAVSVVNPLESAGVTIETDGADVTVTSATTLENVNYILSGSTIDGTCKVYSDTRYYLSLNGVSIANPDGPAINNQSNKKVTVQLMDGTNNVLTDGPDYADPPIGPGGEPEDQDAAFFSEGQLVFNGTGSLQINGQGLDEHGLRSDDYIRVLGGNLTIASAVNDGIHANNGFYNDGGNVNVTSDGDGIDADMWDIEITAGSTTVHCEGDDASGIKCDSVLVISGGTVSIAVSGDQSAGLNSNTEIHLTGGTVDISAMGGVVLTASGSGYEVSYCTAIKGETMVLIDGCEITISATGEASRGISGNDEIVVISGTVDIIASGDGDTYTNTLGVTDAYHGCCLNADGNISLVGGEITLSHSGDAGKGISSDAQLLIGDGTSAPVINITTTGQNITISGGPNGKADEAKTITTEGPITIESGSITIESADDAIKSKEMITLNGGTVIITDSEEGIEGPNIIINGGELSLKSHDDGFNATYGGGGEQNDGSLLEINGGYAFVNSTNGDPLDSNGDIHINGGVIVVHGPQSSPEVGMDVNGSCIVTGGFMVVSGTNSWMTENASSQSTQHCILFKTNQQVPANSIFHLEDNAGNSLVSFAPMRSYYSIIFSSSELAQGTTYKVYTGGTCTGTLLHGLYTGGTYSGGTLKTTFTLNTMTPTVNF